MTLNTLNARFLTGLQYIKIRTVSDVHDRSVLLLLHFLG